MRSHIPTFVGLSLSITTACAIAERDDGWCAEADLVPEVCSDLAYSAAAGGKADEISQMRGIVVERVGNVTYFKIPLAYTVDGDQRRLFDETIVKFSDALGALNREMIARGVDLAGVLDEATSEEFAKNYEDTLKQVLGTSHEDELESALGESYASPRELWAWQRYLVPQAFIGYFGTRFTASGGVGGGASMTVLVVVQPWLSLAVDHTLPEPAVVDKSYEVDVAVLGAPNVEVGFGVGGGAPVAIGAGAVFGPMDRPEDLAGWGIGLNGSFALPFAGGGQVAFVTVLARPPLFFALLGYNTGTAAGAQITGNLHYVMQLSELLEWIESHAGG